MDVVDSYDLKMKPYIQIVCLDENIEVFVKLFTK